MGEAGVEGGEVVPFRGDDVLGGAGVGEGAGAVAAVEPVADEVQAIVVVLGDPEIEVAIAVDVGE